VIYRKIKEKATEKKGLMKKSKISNLCIHEYYVEEYKKDIDPLVGFASFTYCDLININIVKITGTHGKYNAKIVNDDDDGDPLFDILDKDINKELSELISDKIKTIK